jgi:hypothetical protein
MKGLTELDLIMKNLIDIEAEMQSHEKTVNEIYQKVAQGEAIVGVSRCTASKIHLLTRHIRTMLFTDIKWEWRKG